MEVATWRKRERITQSTLAERLGLGGSKGRISRLERKADKWPTDLAIKLDRLTGGEVTVAELRPDLHDVRVVQPEGARA